MATDLASVALDGELVDEDKAKAIAEQDLRSSRKQSYSGRMLLWLSFQATGVIYGDIGTSPLYVFSSTFSSQPSWDDLVGALSIIIWSLTLIVTVKYCFIVLRADDDGQGGTFALYSLLTRYTKIAREKPGWQSGNSNAAIHRYSPESLGAVGRGLRSFLESSRASQVFLQLIGVLGVAMVLADGVLTPAQSVLGAIQGITVVNPDLKSSAIVGITCAVLVVLFLIQPFGTSKIGSTFAPIVTIWLLFNCVAGIYNLVIHDYTVLKAFSPYFAFTYLIRNGQDGWKSLGGLLLAFTGVEALFADLGAFSQRAVQLSWLCLAYPCLLMAYAGQAAFISTDAAQTAYTNPFFYTVPPGTFYFGMVIAVLAAIVASQAMITSSFQLLTQIMRLSYFPHVKVVHTSKIFHDQVYIPLANWLLLIGTVIVTAVYNNTTALGNAYGVCVICVTFITTCMTAFVAILVWRVHIAIVFPVWLLFAALDATFLSSVLTKVPDGAWFTVMLAALLCTLFTLWRFGKESQWTAEAQDNLTFDSLVQPRKSNGPEKNSDGDSGPSQPEMDLALDGTLLTTVPGIGIFFDKSSDSHALPPCFTQFITKFAARPAIVIFFHMRPLPRPYVPDGEQYMVMRMAGLPTCYRVTLRHGYMDVVMQPTLARDIINQVTAAVTMSPTNPKVGAELETLATARNSQIVYILGKETMKISTPAHGNRFFVWLRSVVLWIFLWIRENTRAKLADLNIDANQLIEVGFVKEI